MEQTKHNLSNLSAVEHDALEEQILSIPAAGRDLTLVSAAHAVIHALSVLMPLIYPIIQVEYHLSYTQIGLIVAIPNAVGGLLQIIFGLLSRYILRKVMLGLGNVTTYVPLYLQNIRHLNGTTISIFFTILLVGSVLGPLLGGRLSDLVGRRIMLYVFYGASALTTILFTLVAGPGMPEWLIPLSLILMGFAVYAESPLLQAYLADTASPAIRDTSFSLYFALAFGVGSIWSGILGWIIDHFGFGAAFWTMAASYVAAGLLLLLIRRESPVESEEN